MKSRKILLSAATLALLTSPAFATSESSVDTAVVPSEAATADAAPTLDAPAADPVTAPAEPVAAPTLDTNAPVTIDTAPADTTVPADATTDTAPATIDTTTTPTPETTAAEPAVTEPVVEEKKEEPTKPKVSPPAKLSALAKKYDLMSLDTDGNKSLSKDEFTANGFSNAKTFASFDLDGNGKLTNYEINAYAARIEANSSK